MEFHRSFSECGRHFALKDHWEFFKSLHSNEVLSLPKNPLTLWLLLCTKFSWFCSFCSASAHISPSRPLWSLPVHHSLWHNRIPLHSYTTTCSAIPRLMGIPSISNSWSPQKEQLYIFLYMWVLFHFFMISLGYRPSNHVTRSKSRHSLVALWA